MQPSELVLNRDGSIYHINLFPEDVARTVILVGDPGRVPLVSQHFDKILVRKSKREFITHTGILNGHDLTVISTGIGTDNIEIVINEIDALFNIDLERRQVRDEVVPLTFIRLGTSGALQPEISVHSVVLSRYALGLDAIGRMGLNYTDDRAASWFAQLKHNLTNSGVAFEPAYMTMSSEKLAARFSDWAQPWVTLTCAGFYGLQGRSLRLQSNQVPLFTALREFEHDGLRAGNLEMETAAIYLLAGLLGHQALSLSAILANRATGAFSQDPRVAVLDLIDKALMTLTAS